MQALERATAQRRVLRKECKKLKKVLDKRKRLWYNDRALKRAKEIENELKSSKKEISKNLKKFLTNANGCDIIAEHWKERRDENEGWKVWEKISKKIKKALDKSETMWYNHKALLREGNEPWKLNNDKNETLED